MYHGFRVPHLFEILVTDRDEIASLHPVPSYITALQTTDLTGFALLPVEDPLTVDHQALPWPHSHPVPKIQPSQQGGEQEGVRSAGLLTQYRNLGRMLGHTDLF